MAKMQVGRGQLGGRAQRGCVCPYGKRRGARRRSQQPEVGFHPVAHHGALGGGARRVGFQAVRKRSSPDSTSGRAAGERSRRTGV
jgi:hypothetical protein